MACIKVGKPLYICEAWVARDFVHLIDLGVLRPMKNEKSRYRCLFLARVRGAFETKNIESWVQSQD
jgi:hypothetical protein